MPRIRQNPKTIGTLFSKNSLFMRTEVGKAVADDGTVYEISQNVTGQPIVRNETTGKWWVLSLQDLITFAKAAGIDDESEELIDV